MIYGGELTQSTAESLTVFLEDDTDGVTGVTGATPTVTVSKNGAAYGAKDAGTSIAELSGGDYMLTLSAVDTATLGNLDVKIVATGALTERIRFRVKAATPGVNVTQWLGEAPSALVNPGLVPVNVEAFAGITASAAGIASFYTTVDAAKQYVRDAFKLAPSAGAAAAGSVDAQIAALPTAATVTAIKAKTDTIGAVSVTVTSPIANGDEIDIVAGGDHTGSRAWTWSYTGHDLTAVGTTARLRLLTASNYASNTDTSACKQRRPSRQPTRRAAPSQPR
jgi:hypothetical protein